METKLVKEFLIRCPKCGELFRVEIEGHPVGKYRRCTSCKHNFCIHRNPSDSAIIKELGLKKKITF